MNGEYRISPATPEDNIELIELFNKYPVSSSLSYTIDRSPDYFSFCNLHDNWKVIVAKAPQLTGAITVTFSKVFLEGKVRNLAYMSDLRLDTSARGTGLGDKLMKEGLATCHKLEGQDIPIFSCVIKDNSAGLKKLANLGRDNLANFTKVAEIITYFILPFSFNGINKKVKDYTVRYATKEDLPEMISLWNEVNSKKNLARVLSCDDFEEWLNKATGLSISSYLLAVDKNNKIKAFLGIWDQSAIRRIIITAETNFIKLTRKTWNVMKPLSGLADFPRPGQSLDFFNVVNLCIPGNEAETLPLLLSSAFKIVRNNNSLFLAIALDKKDPLNKQLKGFLSSTSELVLLSNYDFNNNSPKGAPVFGNTKNDSQRGPVSEYRNNQLYHLEISMG